jgi:hypothetical protein
MNWKFQPKKERSESFSGLDIIGMFSFHESIFASKKGYSEVS